MGQNSSSMFLEQYSLAVHIPEWGILLYFGELAHVFVLLQKNGINLSFFVTNQFLIYNVVQILGGRDIVGMWFLWVHSTSRPRKRRSLLVLIGNLNQTITSLAYFIRCLWSFDVLGGQNHLLPLFFKNRHVLQSFFMLVNVYYFFSRGINMSVNCLISWCRAASGLRWRILIFVAELIFQFTISFNIIYCDGIIFASLNLAQFIELLPLQAHLVDFSRILPRFNNIFVRVFIHMHQVWEIRI